MNEFMIPIAFFAAIYGIVYLSIRKKERMALLDRGLDPKSFDTGTSNFSSLKYGLLMTGIGFGILTANVIVAAGLMTDEAAYFSFVALFGGIALIIDYILEVNIRKRSQKSDNQTEL